MVISVSSSHLDRFVLMAFDPGGTTGVAILNLTGLESGIPTPILAQLGPHTHRLELWDIMNEYNPTHVVYESFEFRNKARDNLELISRDYIGIIGLWSDLNPTRLYKQSAAQAKGFIKDTGPNANVPLKRLGWYVPGKKHAMDAVRHLTYFLINGPHHDQELRNRILETAFKA